MASGKFPAVSVVHLRQWARMWFIVCSITPLAWLGAALAQEPAELTLRDVIYYEVPRSLVLQFGQPPAGYRYVRVAGDILLIAIGTAMVIDAIQDLGR